MDENLIGSEMKIDGKFYECLGVHKYRSTNGELVRISVWARETFCTYDDTPDGENSTRRDFEFKHFEMIPEHQAVDC